MEPLIAKRLVQLSRRVWRDWPAGESNGLGQQAIRRWETFSDQVPRVYPYGVGADAKKLNLRLQRLYWAPLLHRAPSSAAAAAAA